MSAPKTITRDIYLQALGLFMLATNHYRIMREAEFRMNELLGLDADSGTPVADAIYTDGGGTNRDFDRALERQDIKSEST